MEPVWMTFSDLFKVMIIQRQITWKWYNIQLYLHWPTNRKSYMIYRTASFSMILNDPYPQFQGHAILWCWISQKWYDIQTYCHWNTNRDLHTLYARVSFQMTLNDLASYSVTRSVVRSLCDSWASCVNIIQLTFIIHVLHVLRFLCRDVGCKLVLTVNILIYLCPVEFCYTCELWWSWFTLLLPLWVSVIHVYVYDTILCI